MNYYEHLARSLFHLAPNEPATDYMREIAYLMFDGNRCQQLWAVRTFRRMMGHP